jgi:hypothetical protein
VGAQAVWTFADAFRRVRSGRGDVVPVSLAFAMLILWAVTGGHTTFALLAIAYFANPVFTSRPVLGRLLERSTIGGEQIALTALAAGVAASWTGLAPPTGGALAWAVAAVFAVVAGWNGIRAVVTLWGQPAVSVTPAEDQESARAAS